MEITLGQQYNVGRSSPVTDCKGKIVWINAEGSDFYYNNKIVLHIIIKRAPKCIFFSLGHNM